MKGSVQIDRIYKICEWVGKYGPACTLHQEIRSKWVSLSKEKTSQSSCESEVFVSEKNVSYKSFRRLPEITAIRLLLLGNRT